MDKMGPSDNTQTPPKSARWYFFRDGVVHGPNRLEALLDLDAQGTDGKDTLVCRADFQRWYPLRELSHLLKAQESHERETAREIERLHEIVARSTDDLRTSEARTARVETKTIHAPTSDAPKVDVASPPEAPIPEGPLGYYLLKGRLRLGLFRKPFSTAFLHGPLTLGLAWYFWLKNNLMELRWHLSSDFASDTSRLPLFLAAIPGLHVYFFWKLAKLLRTTEEQHNFRRTSAVVAAFLSVLPPLAIVYLQRRINLHWTMHVNHYVRNLKCVRSDLSRN